MEKAFVIIVVVLPVLAFGFLAWRVQDTRRRKRREGNEPGASSGG